MGLRMISPETVATLNQAVSNPENYAAYYYFGMGFGSGCVAGYGFALRTALKASNEMIRFYKNELQSVKARVKELEQNLYPSVIDRRLHPRDND